MAVVTAAVTVERVAPAGERIARAIGVVVAGAGLFLIARAAGLGWRIDPNRPHPPLPPKQEQTNMERPTIVARNEWTAARKRLLVKEKEFNRQRDALSAERRKLPMVQIEREYVFEGPNGRRTLGDLFEGRRQLLVATTISTEATSGSSEGVASGPRPCRAPGSGAAESREGRHLRAPAGA
jgi:Bacterial protein of unknown function (DUF899)